MKRCAVALIAVLSFALPALASDKWVDDYNRGVAAVRAKNYAAGADLLQAAIGVTPMENGQQRVHNEIFTYVPHFWLGIAKFNLGDIDAALREWRASEEQGVVQNTIYFSQLREWQAIAKETKQRKAEDAAAGSKRDANGLIGRAVSAQVDAATAGANRSDSYRAADRKLQEALDTFNRAGVDVAAYRRAGNLAAQARDLYATAADEARKLRAARPVPAPQPAKPKPSFEIPFTPPPQPQPKPQPIVPVPQPVKPQPVEPAPPVVSEELASARVAVQEYRRRLVDLKLLTKDADRFDRELAGNPDGKVIARVVAQVAEKQRELDRRSAAAPPAPAPPATDIRPALESAYRAFAGGDFVKSESMLTHILDTQPTGEAYLLRGCSRYTRAMLSRNSEAMLASAAEDFRTALRMNRGLRIDRSAFSPKLVKFFEEVRNAAR